MKGVITQIEIMVGAKTSDKEDTIRSFLSNFEIQPLSEEIAEETIHLRKAHRLKFLMPSSMPQQNHKDAF